ncbi:MAG: hypothetical protein ACW98D_12350 [Promethearchaeota archaeon]|jgi:hypothetical protein
MVLNWTLAVVADMIMALLIFILAILTKVGPRIKKNRSLFFIRLWLISYSIHFFLYALSNLYLEIFIDQLSLIVMFPTTIFLIIGINYITKEMVFSYTLLLAFGIGVLLLYLVAQPGMIQIQIQSGELAIIETGLLEINYDLLLAITGLTLLYWGVRTRINSPLMIRREANIFIIGLIVGVLAVPTYILIPIMPYNTLIGDIIMVLGFFIFSFALMKEPKLWYILPFTVYRIIVKDRNGNGLFDHDWTESNINEQIFTGFVNAVQLMSEEVMHIGGVLSIDLDEGVLILTESQNITVGLVSSKSSKLLRDSIVGFSIDFEVKFQRELKKSIIDKREYMTAYELIEKYFSNFPSKLIKSKKEPLLLMTKYKEPPLALENELRNIIEDESKIQTIKEEMMNSPYGTSPTFFDLYNELKDKPDTTSEEENK